MLKGGAERHRDAQQAKHVVRAKDFNTGLRGVLFEARHYARMGQAVWLYGWLVLRQTRQVGTMGLVLGGRPVSYREIEEETGFHPRTLERWMRVLRREGYIETTPTPAGVVVRITKAKKFPQMPADLRALVRRSAGRLPSSAGQRPQNCGQPGLQMKDAAVFAGGIGSRYLKDEKQAHHEAHTGQEQPQPTPFETTKNLGEPVGAGGSKAEGELVCEGTDATAEAPRAQRGTPAGPEGHGTEAHAMARQWQIRKEAREELVRRELGVGHGPELSGE